jgi:hypothetical protein
MEYPKIETLYERDEKTHKLKPELILKNRTYSLIKTWLWTEKIDGMNIRCIWDGSKVLFAGKTDAAQLPGDLLTQLNMTVDPSKLYNIFQATPAVLYGEGYGAGIQRGGLYSKTKEFIMFDVLVDGKWWLDWDNVKDVAYKMQLDTVPFVMENELKAAAKYVFNGFVSSLGEHPAAEGLVGKTIETLFDKKGSRLIIKLKTKDFAVGGNYVW